MLNVDRDIFRIKKRSGQNSSLDKTLVIGRISVKAIYEALVKCKNCKAVDRRNYPLNELIKI